MESKWRLHSRTVINEVAKLNPNVSENELRKLISAAYPFGERKYHPYKIWLSEVDLYFKQKAKIKEYNERLLL